MIEVVQAFDRAPIAQLESDGAAALEAKLEAAARLFADRDSWLKPHQKLDILRKLAALLAGKREHFGRLIAREGGKPLTDALIEVDRAVDGVRNAIEVVRTTGGREVPMGLTTASTARRAFTIIEPIGVVAAISAFNHPLNLIVHQVVPAIGAGCPVIIKPALTTPLCCVDFVKLVHEAGLPEAWCQTFSPRPTNSPRRSRPIGGSPSSASSDRARSAGISAPNCPPARVARSNMAALRLRSSTPAPISTS